MRKKLENKKNDTEKSRNISEIKILQNQKPSHAYGSPLPSFIVVFVVEFVRSILFDCL